MLIDNAKVSAKIVGVIALLAIVMICTTLLSSFGTWRVSANYGDMTERGEPAIAMNVRRARFIADFAHKAYALAIGAIVKRIDEINMIARDIQAAQEARTASTQVLGASESLIPQSGQLENEVSRFQSDVRTA